MPLPLTVSCFSKIQIGFTFLVPAHPGNLGKRAVKRVFKRVCVCVHMLLRTCAYNKVSARELRDDVPPPMAVRSKNLPPSADGSAVRTSLMAGGG